MFRESTRQMAHRVHANERSVLATPGMRRVPWLQMRRLECPMATDFVLDDLIDTLRTRLSETLSLLMPDRPVEELTDRIEPIIQSTLERFDLVPRAAFDNQVAVLERLQVTLGELEQRVSALEAEQPS